ncbi:toll/interleukin-1 receptor domain-containing protein [Streptomyces sp. NPDC088732]|uniref:toll/interleukin-1 receptor domain-containing protein n=1 Tax=Streptomyces sp. NPDC088732 TaxID=3365879 RepID=UPI0038095218
MKWRMRLRKSERSEDYEHYDTFISYATAADRALAPALRHKLRRVGSGLPGTNRRRRRPQLRIYLDQRSTPAGGELSDELKRALDASRTLILLASPEAAESTWINHEIEWWRERDASRPVLVAHTGGQLKWDKEASDFKKVDSDAAPPALYGFFKQEPKWVDLRPFKRRWLIHPRIAFLLSSAHNIVCQLASPVYGEKVEVLLREERRRRRSNSALFAIFMAMVVLVGWVVWKGARNEADAQEQLATSRAMAHRSAEEAEQNPVLAARLAVAAYAMKPTPESTTVMIQRMDQMRHVQLIRDHQVDGTVSFVAAAVGPDNLFAFSGRDGSTIEVWDAGLSHRVHLLTAPVSEDAPPGAGGEGWGDIDQLVFSPDGRRLFASQIGHGIRSWNLAEGGREGPNTDRIGSTFAIAADASLIAAPGGIDTGNADAVLAEPVGGNGLEFWDPERGVVTTAPPLSPRLRIDDVVISPDGRRVLALATNIDSDRATLRAWDLRRRQWLPKGEAIALPGTPTAFSPDGSRIAAVRGTRVEFVDTGNGSRHGRASLPAGCDVYDLKAAADGRTAVVGCADGRVFALDLRSGSRTELFRHAESIRALAIGSDGRRVLSTDERQLALTTPGHDNRFRRLSWGASVSRAEWDDAGRLGALEQDRIAVYNPERVKPIDRSSPGDGRGTEWLDLVFSPDGHHLTTIGVSGDAYRLVRWRREPLTPVWQTTADRLGAQVLYSVVELSSGMLAVATDKGVRLVGRDGRPGSFLKGEGPLAADPHGRRLATLTVSGYEAPRTPEAVVEVRQPGEKGQLSAPVQLRLPDAYVTGIAMSPDGSTLILSVVHWNFTADGTEWDGEKSSGMELWDPRTGRRKSVVRSKWPAGSQGWVADGAATRLVSFAPESVTFHYVDRGGPAPTWTSPWDIGTPLAVAGNRSGDQAAVVTSEGTTLWDLNPEHWRTALCRIADGGLTAREWQEFTPRRSEAPQSCT